MIRLLNTETGELVPFQDPRKVRYAILSHVWSKDNEQTYEQTREIIRITRPGTTPLSKYSDKIQKFCKIAREHGFKWGWVDSCCIDKSSSSELSEAITSMYDWYRCAGTCYAFLHDLRDIDTSDATFFEEFRKAAWFGRGWTLQELLAPSVLLFLYRDWRVIGSKYTLALAVEKVTGIDRSVLTFEQSMEGISVAHKMSWAASRETTRLEDEAYSLMGIFGVSISVSYGEGRYAFIRLQEEIIKHYADQTIFAWGRILEQERLNIASLADHDDATSTGVQFSHLLHPPMSSTTDDYLLASSPRLFKGSSNFRRIPRRRFADWLGIPALKDIYQEFTVTPHGMHAHIPLLTIHNPDEAHFNILPTHIALLACESQDRSLLALLLRPQPISHDSLRREGIVEHESESEDYDFLVGAAVVGDVRDLLGADIRGSHYRLTHVSEQKVTSHQQDIKMADLYVPHWPVAAAQKLELEEKNHAQLRDCRERFEVRLSGWSQMLLARDGYAVTAPSEHNTNIVYDGGRLTFMPSTAPGSTPYAVVICNSANSEHITIRIGRCTCTEGQEHHLLAVMVSAARRSSSLDEDVFRGAHSHGKHHPAHVQSWKFRGGFASREVQLKPASTTPQPTVLTLRLTFSNDDAIRPPPEVQQTKAYRLGVEIISGSDDAPPRIPFSAPLSELDPAAPSLEKSPPRASRLSYAQVAAKLSLTVNPTSRGHTSSMRSPPVLPPPRGPQSSGVQQWSPQSRLTQGNNAVDHGSRSRGGVRAELGAVANHKQDPEWEREAARKKAPETVLIIDWAKIKGMTKAQLEAQLEVHRKRFKDVDVPLKYRIPNRPEKEAALLAAVKRYRRRVGLPSE